LTRYLLFLGACSILMIGGGLVFATLLGNRITGSLSLVARRASDLALGKLLPAVPLSPIAELNVVSRALDETGERLERAQRERDRLLEQERDARTSAERANRAKDEFLAMLGHELRNPLGAISNAIGVIRDKRRTDAQLDSASIVISRQTEHLKRLIDDLLDVGRVMTGKIMLEKQPLDLAECVRHVLATLKAAHTTKQHEIAVESTPVWVVADATRIEQIISNLVTNAVTYTPRGGTINIKAERAGEFAVFEITDTGVGIPPEILPNLFELFFQGEQAIDRPNSGLGIGLTLVKKLVELHGGTVAAASAGLGQGATFTVRLPATPVPAQPATLAAPAAKRRQRTVLVIEDNVDARAALRMALELEGHHVHEAGEGRQGLEQARAIRPGVAIVDIGLPGMNGHDVARAMRSEFGRDVFLIALTGYGMPEDKVRAREAGFDMHLTKPVDLAQLATIIDSVHPAVE
jgi:signal transduction histidine kinase/ActR/RegA family two-component response regulator